MLTALRSRSAADIAPGGPGLGPGYLQALGTLPSGVTARVRGRSLLLWLPLPLLEGRVAAASIRSCSRRCCPAGVYPPYCAYRMHPSYACDRPASRPDLYEFILVSVKPVVEVEAVHVGDNVGHRALETKAAGFWLYRARPRRSADRPDGPRGGRRFV